MGISGPKAPDAPNMTKVTSQQAAANTAAGAGSQAGSMVNQNNQFVTSPAKTFIHTIK